MNRAIQQGPTRVRTFATCLARDCTFRAEGRDTRAEAAAHLRDVADTAGAVAHRVEIVRVRYETVGVRA